MSINNDQSFRDNNNSFILNPNNEEDSVLSNIRKIFQTNENNSFIFRILMIKQTMSNVVIKTNQ